jgi:type II secretory pathway pseudopilin PulG
MTSSPRDDGYALAALLVGMAVMAVMLTAAMPVWKTTATREKEAELIFRGQQYARAIGLYQRKMGPGTLPPSIDLLVDQRFLRKKYKDPITNDDFQLLSAGQAAGLAGAQQDFAQAAGRLGQGGRAGRPGPVVGGIMGVVSKSTATSIRLYNNRNKYNEWTFVFAQAAQGQGEDQPGAGGARRGLPGLPGRGRAGRGSEGRGPFDFGPRGQGPQGGQPPPGGRRGRP